MRALHAFALFRSPYLLDTHTHIPYIYICIYIYTNQAFEPSNNNILISISNILFFHHILISYYVLSIQYNTNSFVACLSMIYLYIYILFSFSFFSLSRSPRGSVRPNSNQDKNEKYNENKHEIEKKERRNDW